jgi:hypothetical protein
MLELLAANFFEGVPRDTDNVLAVGATNGEIATILGDYSNGQDFVACGHDQHRLDEILAAYRSVNAPTRICQRHGL